MEDPLLGASTDFPSPWVKESESQDSWVLFSALPKAPFATHGKSLAVLRLYFPSVNEDNDLTQSRGKSPLIH